jgi:hypothetical protein
MIVAVLAAVALAGDPSVRPWPIGPGPRYLPAAASAAVIDGRPVGELRCASAGKVFRVHLELFAHRRVVVVPAGIGVAGAPVRQGASVVPRGCSYPARTLTPAGIVEVAAGARLHLADLFRIWGQALGKRRLLSFRSASPVRAYVGGRLVRGPAGAVTLTPDAQIVLELGAYVAPHRFFLFPRAAE